MSVALLLFAGGGGVALADEPDSGCSLQAEEAQAVWLLDSPDEPALAIDLGTDALVDLTCWLELTERLSVISTSGSGRVA